MVVGRFCHKGLKRLYEDDDPTGLPPQSVRKIKAILAALEFADDLSQVGTFPGWRLHSLKGSRKGAYSITVTGNWRITFTVHGGVVGDLDFEDYH
jgi:proteic killer suppression protein